MRKMVARQEGKYETDEAKKHVSTLGIHYVQVQRNCRTEQLPLVVLPQQRTKGNVLHVLLEREHTFAK